MPTDSVAGGRQFNQPRWDSLIDRAAAATWILQTAVLRIEEAREQARYRARRGCRTSARTRAISASNWA